jgi:membrane fusion protein (multidrug efflux system)
MLLTRRAFILAIVACVGGAALWWWFGRGEPVTLIAATRGTAAEVVYATGTAEPVRWAKVVPLQRKRLVDMCRCEGRDVKAGEVLARQDAAEEEALLAELQARRALLEKDFQRLSGLLERNITSVNAVDQAQTALKEADARIIVARERLNQLTLRAPIDGTVLREDFQIGEIVGPGDVVFTVGQRRPLRIVADVNEEDIARVKVGQAVLLRNDGFTQPLPATVADVTPKGDPLTKTFRVYLALPEDTPLLIGMSVEANIITQEVKDAVLVPSEAVRGNAVFTVENGKIVRRPVTVGLRGARMLEIKAGLREGERIIAPAPTDEFVGARARIIERPS